jgi:FtsP/CotA-like multicopper oxidase with cupredoxin domain
VKVRHTVSDPNVPMGFLTSDPTDFMWIEVAGQGIPDTDAQSLFIPEASYPKMPVFLQDIGDDEVKGSKTITFNSTGPWHTIDGKLFDDTVGQVVLLNKVEEWKIENTTTRSPQGDTPNPAPGPINHPFHIHINPFQVTEIFDPNELLLDSQGKPRLDSSGKPVGTAEAPVEKYVFDKQALQFPELQCLLDLENRRTWRDCHEVKPRNIWWDVFSIPGGREEKGKVIPG